MEADRGGRVSLLVGDRGPGDDPRGVRRVHPRGGGDLLRVAPGDRGHPVEGKLVHPPPERVEARGPAGHEVAVVKTLVEDHLDPAEAHRGVGPGPERQPEIGELRVLGAPRVEHDELRPVPLRGPDRVVDGGPTVLAGVVAEEDDAARPRVVGIREPAVHHAVDRGGVAGAQGHPRNPVGRAEKVHEPAPRAVLGLGVPLAGGDREGSPGRGGPPPRAGAPRSRRAPRPRSTRCQRPSPRSPARRSGWSTRSGCANPEGAWTPFMQMLERRGRGSRAFTRATRPSSTSTCTWQ